MIPREISGNAEPEGLEAISLFVRLWTLCRWGGDLSRGLAHAPPLELLIVDFGLLIEDQNRNRPPWLFNQQSAIQLR
jgi:hypothetical protein